MGMPRHEIQRMMDCLYEKGMRSHPLPATSGNTLVTSVVAFLLRPSVDGNDVELLLTRRSARVRQTGDLCCPGGGTEPALDAAIARLLRLPGSPLTRWPFWGRWRKDAGAAGRALAGLMATALRECYEEIRLLPVGLRFLGILPPQQLVLFKRTIYPMTFWVSCQRRFLPNWEVDAMVSVPISKLLSPSRYICYRLRFDDSRGQPDAGGTAIKDFYGYRYTDDDDNKAVLWGATFRITMNYLRLVHDFEPPALEALPVITRTIGSDYFTGNGAARP